VVVQQRASGSDVPSPTHPSAAIIRALTEKLLAQYTGSFIDALPMAGDWLASQVHFLACLEI
jgi:hypothetical protein